MIILKRSLDNQSQEQAISPEQAVTELARFLPASQYGNRLEILATLADGQMICTNLYGYQLQADSKPYRTNPQTSDYSREYLDKRHLETYRKIAAEHPTFNCQMVGSWILRVSNHGASLITEYRVSDSANETLAGWKWSAVQEHSEAL